MKRFLSMVMLLCGCRVGVQVFEPAPSEMETPPATMTPPQVVIAPPGLGVADYVPLFASDTDVFERIQYAEADGTLVTFAGFRPTPRHAREGGEPWTSTVDQGPGNYFAFSTFYFQNRTFGLIIRDEVPAGRQRITAYLNPNNGVMINNSFSAFRRLDPNVIEYGWKMGIGFKNPLDGSQRCSPATKLEEMCVAIWQDGATILDYWRQDDEAQYQGISRPKALQIGDKIEMTPGVFLDFIPGTAVALIDNGQSRDYSLEQLYVVGKGFVPWYGIAPRLDTTPLPDDALLGGQASVSYNYSEEPHRVFQQPVNNIGPADMQRFVEGRRLFHTSFRDGKHTESPNVNPVFSEHIGQLGQRYNEERCFACHVFNGRSPAVATGESLTKFAVLTSASTSTGAVQVADPTYGFNVQQLALDGSNTQQSVSVERYTTSTHTLPDGESVELQTPVYRFEGGLPAQLSVRQAPQVVGMGLIEAIDERDILALADPDDQNGDGVRGVPNWAVDPETGWRHVGRFGWKAGKGSVRHQVSGAFLLDMGVTTPAFHSASCQRGTDDCKSSTTSSISEKEMDRISAYVELLGVPAHRKYASGYTDGIVVPPEHTITAETTATIEEGARLFGQVGCTVCHVSQFHTANTHPFAELRGQTIHPYSDFLLHDMGADLADSRDEGQARASMWRTQPLWGLGSLKYTQAGTGFAEPLKVRYLHDGRARTLMEAIAWHGGEGVRSRDAFEALSKPQRAAVLTFLDSL